MMQLDVNQPVFDCDKYRSFSKVSITHLDRATVECCYNNRSINLLYQFYIYLS